MKDEDKRMLRYTLLGFAGILFAKVIEMASGIPGTIGVVIAAIFVAVVAVLTVKLKIDSIL